MYRAFMARLTALLLALMFLCPAAATADMMPYPEEMVISVVPLTKVQKDLVMYLYPRVINCETDIPLPAGTLKTDITQAIVSLQKDYPELFHIKGGFTTWSYSDAPDVATSVSVEYAMSYAESQRVRQQIHALAMEMIARGGDALSLHDQLVEHITYDNSDKSTCHNLMGPMLKGRSVCEGYAQAMAFVYRLAGIPCGIIEGDTSEGLHAWNIAYINGYTLIDATWNDQEWNHHWYYGLSTERMGLDHFPTAGQNIPYCGEQDNWYVQHGRRITRMEEAFPALRDLAVKREPAFLWVDDPSLYARIIADPWMLINAYNENCAPGEQMQPRFSYMQKDVFRYYVLLPR